MFDIGFSELVLCLLIALVVIGPEQLPQAVRSVALWVGRLKRSLRDTREEIERQIGADDIRRQLHNEEIMRSLEETNRRIQDTMAAASATARDAQNQLSAPAGTSAAATPTEYPPLADPAPASASIDETTSDAQQPPSQQPAQQSLALDATPAQPEPKP